MDYIHDFVKLGAFHSPIHPFGSLLDLQKSYTIAITYDIPICHMGAWFMAAMSDFLRSSDMCHEPLLSLMPMMNVMRQ